MGKKDGKSRSAAAAENQEAEDASPEGGDIVAPEQGAPSKKRSVSSKKNDSSVPQVSESDPLEKSTSKKHNKEKKAKKEKESKSIYAEEALGDESIPTSAEEPQEKGPKEKKHKRKKDNAASEPAYAVGDLSKSLFGDEATVPVTALFSAIPEAPARVSAPPLSSDEGESEGESASLSEDPSAEAGGDEGARDAKEDKHSKEKLARTVFVGNVPVETAPKVLKALFKAHGTVQSVRLRSVALAKESLSSYRKAGVLSKQFHPQRSTCNAYVVFSSRAEAEDALQLNNALLQDKHLHVDLATATNKYKEADLSVFVGNLPFDAEEEDLREHFNACGDIEYVRLVRDKETNVGKGIGYVKFKDAEGLAAALLLHGHEFRKRELRVLKAKTKKVEPKRNARGRGATRGSRGGAGVERRKGSRGGGTRGRGVGRGDSGGSRGGAGRGGIAKHIAKAPRFPAAVSRGGERSGGSTTRGRRGVTRGTSAGRGRGGFARGGGGAERGRGGLGRGRGGATRGRGASRGGGRGAAPQESFEGRRAEPGVVPHLKRPRADPHTAARRKHEHK